MVDLDTVVGFTLAANQSTQARTRYTRLAGRAREAYVSVDSAARQRWSRIGCSIGSARKIDEWASQIARALISADVTSVSTALEAVGILRPTIAELLRLPEAPRWGFRESVQGATLDVDAAEVLRDWLEGASLPLSLIHI